MFIHNPSKEEIDDILANSKRIAVVGLSDKEDRTSFKIASFLQNKGYNIVPVNPLLKGKYVLNEKVVGTLEEIRGHIDIVNIFRRSEFLPEIARSFLTIDAHVFWAQLGIENEEAWHIIEGSNHPVIMDKCIKIEIEKM